MNPPHVVVVGGGIAGLTAAWRLATGDHPLRVTVLEADDRLGGKIGTTEFAGVPVDTGPDAFLTRNPAIIDLCRELGIEGDLIAPDRSNAFVFTKGFLRRFPKNSVLGVPSSLRSLATSNVVSARSIVEAALDYLKPHSPIDGDVSVADAFRRRLGEGVVDRLIDPLVGGINGGSTARLSLQAAAPQLAELTKRRSVMRAAAEVVGRRREGGRPTFQAPPAGMAELVDSLAAALRASGVEIHLETRVQALIPSADGWSLRTEQLDFAADAVVLATPAYVTADLVRPFSAKAATELDAIPYASISMVRLAYRPDAVERELEGSGYVVPTVDGNLLTAVSWASSKWSRLAKSGRVIFRASAGRHGDDRAEEMSDRELIAAAHHEIDVAIGLVQRPVKADVIRWPRSFPQYVVGHHERVGRIETALTGWPNLALAGAAYRGLGIPSCVSDGNRAAALVRKAFGNNPGVD